MSVALKPQAQKNFAWHGRSVFIPAAADIPPAFRPGKRFGDAVQTAMDELGAIRGGKQGSILTMEFSSPLFRAAVSGELDADEPRQWYRHKYHTARNVQVSPFVIRPVTMTNLLTLQMVRINSEPALVRVQPGGATPPLPWQNSARQCVDWSCRFWLNHAYVYAKHLVIGPPQPAPSWFASSEAFAC